LTMGLLPLLGHASTPLTGTRQSAKEKLARCLFDRYRPTDVHGPPRISVTADGSGRPLLCGPDAGDCRISFSYCNHTLWAALAAGSPVGIDVESPASFAAPYPYDRVFSGWEWRCINDFDKSRPQVFAAALWACKEAAVKARGTGFSDLSPLEVCIDSIAVARHGYRVKLRTEKTYLAIVQPHNLLWLAIACPGQ